MRLERTSKHGPFLSVSCLALPILISSTRILMSMHRRMWGLMAVCCWYDVRREPRYMRPLPLSPCLLSQSLDTRMAVCCPVAYQAALLCLYLLSLRPFFSHRRASKEAASNRGPRWRERRRGTGGAPGPTRCCHNGRCNACTTPPCCAGPPPTPPGQVVKEEATGRESDLCASELSRRTHNMGQQH